MGERTMTPEYGITIKNALLYEVQSKQQRTVIYGTIFKVEISSSNGNNLCVRFLKDGETWESVTFTCKRDDVVFIGEKLWPFLAAVTSLKERVRLAQDPKMSKKLMDIALDTVVGFDDRGDTLLGTIKYKGKVKGIGSCYGIQLHEKKADNRCDGSCAGIQYFACLPGYGIFTTIEKIKPQNFPSTSASSTVNDENAIKRVSNVNVTVTDLDIQLRRNFLRFDEAKSAKFPNDDDSVQLTNFRTSQSLQSINDTYNTNNDFDQCTILQPEKTKLLTLNNMKQMNVRTGEQATTSSTNGKVGGKNKEIDLIEAIGGSWGDKPPTYAMHSNLMLMKNGDGKSAQQLTSKTLPKKTRFTSGNGNGKENRGGSPIRKSNFYIDINERIENSSAKQQELQSRQDGSPLPLPPSPPPPPPPPLSQQQNKKEYFYDPQPGTTNDLSVGSLVEVINDVCDEPLYGVIRWMGVESDSRIVVAGVELEDELSHLPLTLTDGMYKGSQMFECANHKALFVPLPQCRKDSRFQDGTPTPVHNVTDKLFGNLDCPVIEGYVAPLCLTSEEDVSAVCGQFRGIQGHHNSCYLDATLFSMFTYTSVFDSVLYRPKNNTDIPHYEEVQRVLREEIVNPLRANLFVRADYVMNLRKLLDKLSSVSGLMTEEKDPEEFLNSLLAQILKAEPFLKLSSGQEAYHYQLFVDKDNDLELPTVQQLFEQSFSTSDIKLKEVPSCLIVQMPRFGKNYKMYPRILPSQILDVTDVIENSPRQCTVCGTLACWECKECYGQCDSGLESVTFCNPCLERAHTHNYRSSHRPRSIHVAQDFLIMADHCHPPRLYMELFAVICIETSHYVAFVKCGAGHEAPWCFFDSMADRKGERNGYNIPEMVACPDVSRWLSDEQLCREVHAAAPTDKLLPEYARRLLCDAYICMYQSPDVMMYR